MDLWAVGCIFAELFNSSPVFPGENDIEQLCCVLRVLGTPTEASWPGMTSLPDYNKITFADFPSVPFEQVVPDASSEALSLLEKFLVFPSEERLPAADALLHPYFFTEPLPAHHSELPIPTRQHRRGESRRDPFGFNVPLEKSLVSPALLNPFGK